MWRPGDLVASAELVFEVGEFDRDESVPGLDMGQAIHSLQLFFFFGQWGNLDYSLLSLDLSISRNKKVHISIWKGPRTQRICPCQIPRIGYLPMFDPAHLFSLGRSTW